jgi:hypothetical protein
VIELVDKILLCVKSQQEHIPGRIHGKIPDTGQTSLIQTFVFLIQDKLLAEGDEAPQVERDGRIPYDGDSILFAQAPLPAGLSFDTGDHHDKQGHG